jgi:hypothetical protein
MPFEIDLTCQAKHKEKYIFVTNMCVTAREVARNEKQFALPFRLNSVTAEI